MTFQELSERWNAAEGPTLKASTLSHYLNALRGYVLPAFESRKIAMINREDIQTFLAEKAKRYSMATLRSIKVTLGLTLGWAHNCGWLSSNPCRHIKLPKQAGGRKVSRTALSAVQIAHLSEKLEEPYATLVLFLAATGLRIGEAIAVTWTDISGAVLAVSRRIYCGDVDQVKSLKSRRELPLDSHLIERMRVLGEGQHWVFRSQTGTPLNPGNALKRYIRPAAKALSIAIGGWHDFRHTLSTRLRRSGVHPKVISDILGHNRVNLAMDVYDRTDVTDFAEPLSMIAKSCYPTLPKPPQLLRKVLIW